MAKCFHHHAEAAVASKFGIEKAEVKSQANCAVCDYHFTKDVDAATSFAVVQLPLTHLSAPAFYILPATTSIGMPSADRGPPALV